MNGRSRAGAPAPQVADIFYTALSQDGPGTRRSAQALHHAVRALRREDPTNPLAWAPYIHLGT
jgi:hypothetical protein